MKRLALLASVALVSLSTAIPLAKVQLEIGRNGEEFHDNHLNLYNETPMFKRSPTSVKLAGSPKLAGPAKIPAQSKTFLKSMGQPDVAIHPAQKYATRSGNGKIYDAGPYPPAEASGLLKGLGFYETSTHDRLMPESIEQHSSGSNPEGKTVYGPVSAYVKSVSMINGSKSTAQGMHKARATVEKTSYANGCITCEQPGQAPIKVTVAAGTGSVAMEAYNANPRLGPIKMTAETYGMGVTTAAASNQPI